MLDQRSGDFKNHRHLIDSALSSERSNLLGSARPDLSFIGGRCLRDELDVGRDAFEFRGEARAWQSEAHRTDTFVVGPSWEVFAKEMGLEDAAKAGSVYVVAT